MHGTLRNYIVPCMKLHRNMTNFIVSCLVSLKYKLTIWFDDRKNNTSCIRQRKDAYIKLTLLGKFLTIGNNLRSNYHVTVPSNSSFYSD